MNRGSISFLFILVWGCGVVVTGFPLMNALTDAMSRMGFNFVNSFTSNFMNRRNSDQLQLPEWMDFKVKFNLTGKTASFCHICPFRMA